MDLLLHIGTEKTGTTTLQSFLALNRDLLADHRVWVPKSPVPKSLPYCNHRKLVALANDDDFIDDFIKRQKLLDPAQRKRAKQGWLEAFDKEQAGTNTCTRAVISSEHFQSRLRQEHEIARLHALLSRRFARITVVIYLRDPYATALSALSTAIRVGGTQEIVPPPNNVYWHNLVHHRQTLERWGRVFGRANLRVRLFERDAFAGSDLVQDFITACDLPALEYQTPAPLNETLSGSGMALLARVNRLIPPFLADNSPNPYRHGIVPYFSRHFTAQSPPNIPARQQQLYQEAFADSNEWVRQKFFPDRQHLFAPRPTMSPEPAPHPNQSADENLDRIAALIADIWRHR
jgi:hypothetical protein